MILVVCFIIIYTDIIDINLISRVEKQVESQAGKNVSSRYDTSSLDVPEGSREKRRKIHCNHDLHTQLILNTF